MTIKYEIGTPRKDRLMRISLIMNVGTTKKRIHTDLFVNKSDLTRTGKIRPDAPIYNKVIELIRITEREFAALDTFLTGERMTASEAYRQMNTKGIPSFFSYAERWVSRSDIKGLKNYKSALNSFRKFLGGNDITFQMFSHKLLDDYFYTLRESPRAPSLYLNAIKKIYEDAEKDYDIMPFYKFRFSVPKQKASRHRAIDKKTLVRIFSYKGDKRRSVLARDCAILSFCLCATNTADLYNAPKIRNNILAYDRTKTRERRADNAHIEINIPSQIKALVEKYKDNSRAFCFHRSYSTFDNFQRAINIGLKDIQKDIETRFGIKMPPLTFYDFRHSYATIARNDLQIEKSTVHEILNHVERETAIDDVYIRKDFRLINIANQKITDYVMNAQIRYVRLYT